MDKPSYYSIIPATVRYDEKLSSSEKLLYGEISALINMHGTCFASNGYFARLYDVSTRTVTRWITSLKDRGHIEVETGDDQKRFITMSYIDTNIDTSRHKRPETHDKSVQHSIIENNIITTGARKRLSTKDESMSQMLSSDLRFKSLSSLSGIKVLLDQFEAHRSEIRKPMTIQARKVMLGKLTKYHKEGFDPCEMLETAVERGWLSIYPPKEKKGHRDAQNYAPIRGGVI